MFEQLHILVFFHTLALVVALGGSIFMIFFLPAILQGKSISEDKIPIMVRAINLFVPVNFGMLAVIVITGVLLLFSLYEKISDISSPLYLNVFLVKIVLVCIVFSIATYQTFPLRFKIVSMKMDKISAENLPKPFQIMRTCSIVNMILISIVILLGITMSRLA